MIMNNYYHILPQDFRNYYLQNWIYEIFFFGKLTKRFDKEGYYINIYDYRTNNGKKALIHKLRYNTMISSYEINTTRYQHYEHVYNIMWNLDKHPPL